jgi:hypothetical protein
MERPGAHFHVVRLHDDAATFSPVLLQPENQVLEAQVAGCGCGAHSGVLPAFKGAQYNDFLPCLGTSSGKIADAE